MTGVQVNLSGKAQSSNRNWDTLKGMGLGLDHLGSILVQVSLVSVSLGKLYSLYLSFLRKIIQRNNNNLSWGAEFILEQCLAHS